MALRVLVVEDDGLIALTLEDLLEELGCQVAGSAGSVAEALAWLEAGNGLDAALLDVKLGTEMVFPVAEALAARHIAFAFTTGLGEAPDARFRSAPLLTKPIRRADLQRVLGGFGL